MAIPMPCTAAPCGSARPGQRRRPPARSTGRRARCSSHSPATRTSPPNFASSTRPTPFSSSARTAAGSRAPCPCPGARSGSSTPPTGNLSSPAAPGRSSSRRSRQAGTAGGCASSRWSTCRPSACETAGRTRSNCRARPRLLLGDPLPGVATPGGSPVYPVPPRLHLPQDLGANIRWHAEVSRAGSGAPVAVHAVGPASEIDIWEGIPRPVLGAFEITVRGPLGRGLRRTVFVAEGLSVGYHPEVRPLTRAGLAAGTARLTAAAGATALPATLRFGPGERAQVVEYRTDAGPEPLVITPPHATVLCSGAGVTTWTTSQVHLVAEDFAKAGHLLVRVPAAGQPGQVAESGNPDRLELAVLVRGQQGTGHRSESASSHQG